MCHALELCRVSRRFVVGLGNCRGSVDVLRSVDLAIAPGEVVAIVGAAGAGKSTLLLVASGLLGVDAGEVRWFGQCDRTIATERATYYFAGARSLRPPGVLRSRAPHLHLVDGVESLCLTSPRRISRWIEGRRESGDAVIVAMRTADAARDFATRVLTLRSGCVFSDDPVSVPARVAEPVEHSGFSW